MDPLKKWMKQKTLNYSGGKDDVRDGEVEVSDLFASSLRREDNKDKEVTKNFESLMINMMNLT